MLPPPENVLDKFIDIAYWRGLNPKLSIGGQGRTSRAAKRPKAFPKPLVHDLEDDGYCRAEGVFKERDLVEVKEAIETVTSAGWLPIFAFIYDAPWRLARSPQVLALADRLLGSRDHGMALDFWITSVANDSESHGFNPHKDNHSSANACKNPARAVTVWIALSDATPENGCLYVIPENLERFSVEELEREYGANDFFGAVLHRTRALPAETGTILCWRNTLTHWGSFGSGRASTPRLSLSVAYMIPEKHPDNPNAGNPLLKRDQPLPIFGQRLIYVANSIQNYHYRKDGKDDPFHRLYHDLPARVTMAIIDQIIGGGKPIINVP